MRPAGRGRRSVGYVGSGLARDTTPRGASQDLVKLALVEVGQSRDSAAGIFAKDLDQARNEELLLLVGLRLPVVWLAEGDQKSNISRPLAKVGRDIGACVGLYGGEIIEVPSLSNRESAIDVLLCLVHSHSAGLPDGDDDDSGLLCLGRSSLRGRGTRWVG